MAGLEEQGCCFESSEIISAVDGLAAELSAEIQKFKKEVSEDMEETDTRLIIGGLRTISDQLEEHTNLLKLIAERAGLTHAD